MSQHLEVEVKFSVSESTEIPDLTGIHGVTDISESQVHNLSAVYFDTEDLRLTRAKITLRRRTGGTDAGWHIKFPGTFGRREVHAGLDEPGADEHTPPPALLGHVRALIQGHPLHPIAEVANERHVFYLKNAQGDIVAEFCDDHVSTVCHLPGGARKQWREWEFELAEHLGHEEAGWQLLKSATDVLTSAGAFISDSPSKLVSALGDAIRYAPTPPEKAVLPDDDPAHAVLAAIEANVNKIIEFDPKVRADEWDSVHQMRVATRELRSHMQTFEGVLGGEDYLQVEKELKLLATILGRARDAEVIEERLASLIATEVGDAIDEETTNNLLEDLSSEYRREHTRVVAALDNERYAQLLQSLEDLLVNPPLVTVAEEETTDETPVSGPDSRPDSSPDEVTGTPAEDAGDIEEVVEQLDHAGEVAELEDTPGVVEAAEATGITDTTDLEEAATRDIRDVSTAPDPAPAPAGQDSGSGQKVDATAVLLKHLDRTHSKVVKLNKKALKEWEDHDIPTAQREENFHNVRKAIKKLRYSAEAVGDATEVNTKKLYKACSKLQSVLGDFQDAVTSRDELLRRANNAHKKGMNTFAYGVLYQHEQMLSRKYLEGYRDAYQAVATAYDKLEKTTKKITREKDTTEEKAKQKTKGKNTGKNRRK